MHVNLTSEFQSPHRAYGHSDQVNWVEELLTSPSFNLLIELTVIPTPVTSCTSESM